MAWGRRRQAQRTRGVPKARGGALVASGARIDRDNRDTLYRLRQPWQQRAFAYYDLVPEIKFAAQFYSRMLSPLELHPLYKNDDGEWERTDDPDVTAAIDRIQDPGGGRTNLLSTYGRLIFLVGECELLWTKGEDNEEKWEMVSTDELRIMGDTYMRYKAPGLMPEQIQEAPDEDYEPIEGQAIAYRLWKKHPRYSELADSTMQGVLDVAEELVLLTRAVRGRARSRLTQAGILALDDRITYAPDEPTPDEDVQEDPLLRDITEAMMAPIQDEGSAASVVPFLLRIPVPEGAKIADLIQHIQLSDPMQLYPETGLRMECVKRLAIGLDMPPEVLLGLADANHWSGWAIQEETWRAHGQPIAQGLVDDLTAAYLRPTLKEDGIANWERFAIGYDEAKVVTHPDRTNDAFQLYDKRAIGKEALREAAGFGEDDAPNQEELNEMIGVATRDSSLAIYGIPSVRSGGIEPAPGELEDSSGTQNDAADVKPGPPEGNQGEPPPVTASGNGNGNGNGHIEQEIMEARLIGAAELGILRAREIAGNRIRSHAKKDPDVLALIRGTRAGQVAYELGIDRVTALGITDPSVLVQGVTDLIRDALSMHGISDEVADVLGEQLEKHAARTLFEQRPSVLPPTFGAWMRSMAGTPT